MACAFPSVNGIFVKFILSRSQVYFEVSVLEVLLEFYCEPANKGAVRQGELQRILLKYK